MVHSSTCIHVDNPQDIEIRFVNGSHLTLKVGDHSIFLGKVGEEQKYLNRFIQELTKIEEKHDSDM